MHGAADVRMKPRIHLIGGPGSGKSFAAARLSYKFDVPAYELDDLFWDNTTSRHDVRREPAERDRELASLVKRDGWIIEGVYYGWVAPSFAAADIVIVLTPSIVARQWRVIKRFVLRKAGRVPSKNESLASLWRLLRWSQTFDEQHLGEARRAVTTLSRSWVECRTLQDVFAATCYLERQ